MEGLSGAGKVEPQTSRGEGACLAVVPRPGGVEEEGGGEGGGEGGQGRGPLPFAGSEEDTWSLEEGTG